MLKPELAKERLKAFAHADGKKEREQRIKALPKALQAGAFHALGLDSDGKQRKDLRHWDVVAGVARELDPLTVADRKVVFAALLPGYVEALEKTWALLPTLPYQNGYSRKAFHAPGQAALSQGWRGNWLYQIVQALEAYAQQDVVWLAAWAPYFTSYGQLDSVGRLLAGAIEGGNKAVLDVLKASALGEHEIGAMGRHVTRALLTASHRDGWRLCEQLLLAAQRQEGLRQTILETADEAHPGVFRRLLRLCVEHDLTRFASVTRALDVWLGFGLESYKEREVKEALGGLLDLLDDPEARTRALETGTTRDAYIALWCVAYEDALAAVTLCRELRSDPRENRRFVAVHLLQALGLNVAVEVLVTFLDDPSLLVVACALAARHQLTEAHYETLVRVLPRLPERETTYTSPLGEWQTLELSQSMVADLLPRLHGSRPIEEVLPHLSAMSATGRALLADKLGKERKPSPAVRAALLTLAGDASSWVRQKALEGLTALGVNADEVPQLEALLSRKAEDLRRVALQLLLKQPDTIAFASAERLTAAKTAPQRLAGLELVAQLAKDNRDNARCAALARSYEDRRPNRDEIENVLLTQARQLRVEQPKLENALGLFNPAGRTPVVAPVAQPGPFVSEGAKTILRALDKLIEAHLQDEIQVEQKNWDWQTQESSVVGQRSILLSEATYSFPQPDASLSVEANRARLPLAALWDTFVRTYCADPLDLWRALGSTFAYYTYGSRAAEPDGVEAERLYAWTTCNHLKHPDLVKHILTWLAYVQAADERLVPFLLDAVETMCALPKSDRTAWREGQRYPAWLAVARWHFSLFGKTWTDAQVARFWQRQRWFEQPLPSAKVLPPSTDLLMEAFRRGSATRDDILATLLVREPKPQDQKSYYYGPEFSWLQQLTRRKAGAELRENPALAAIVAQCRERILEVELARGDTPTAATLPALALRSVGGAVVLARLLRAFPKDPFARGYSYGRQDSRSAVLSHLVRMTVPEEADTPELLAGIAEKRLVEAAVYAPQWARLVEQRLGWTGFAESVLWLHAHTKDRQWSVDHEIRESWTTAIAAETPLSAEDLVDGAVDVAWFQRAHTALGAARWKVLMEAAKFASSSGGHKRAELFAGALLGEATVAELNGRIVEKRNQDAVRALGLIPLADDTDLLARYETIQHFLRGARQFGAQRQESEKRAAAIGLENLARTAGYPDPVRLEWAMEARAVADLADGEVKVTVGDVTVTLRINLLGEPELLAEKRERLLKEIPSAVKKDPAVAALVERKKLLERQVSRMRLSLEQAMVRGDHFTADELTTLQRHPVLQPLLRSLVFVAADGAPTLTWGESLPAQGVWRLAHPVDLLASGVWDQWQQECFRTERVQPFKQLFRELYVRTDGEADELGRVSLRYAGHQVQTRQALAILGKRGWVSGYDQAPCKTFHAVGLSAEVSFRDFWGTPGEVEGLMIEGVHFTRKGEWTPLPLAEIPPRLFSEVMRDIDLIVSVAHVGGVDPEASHSTIEMRSALVREAARLLKRENVQVEKNHVLIDGHLARYSVHLGSAMVHREPGGFVCIVPVGNQHRGRLFLPFVDDDPRSAEVVSKVLLLSNDREIKDPTILEQLLR